MKPLIAVSPETVRQVRQHYGDDAALISAALECLAARFRDKGAALCSPSSVRDYLRLLLTPLQHEVFIGIFLDSQNRVIAVEEIFRGTITQTSVYPREVVKKALQHNAAAVVFAHNHPSGIAEPGHSDVALTDTLQRALETVGVEVLDHFVVGAAAATSFAERGLLKTSRYNPAAAALPSEPDRLGNREETKNTSSGPEALRDQVWETQSLLGQLGSIFQAMLDADYFSEAMTLDQADQVGYLMNIARDLRDRAANTLDDVEVGVIGLGRRPDRVIERAPAGASQNSALRPITILPTDNRSGR